MTEAARTWRVEDHLRDASPEHVELYRAVEAAILALGPVTISPSKTTIYLKGARPTWSGGANT